MFTGLVQALGTIEAFDQTQIELSYRSGQIAAIKTGLEIGDSVAVDGVCLTVEHCLNHGFIAAVSPETLKRTTLGQTRSPNRAVNLESSLRAGSKIGGHFVTGHVDGVGHLTSVQFNQNSWEMRFETSCLETSDSTSTTHNSGSDSADRDSFRDSSPKLSTETFTHNIARYIVPKGSIAINGISLTIATCDPLGAWFEVAVIPHTYAETNLHQLQPGAIVNLEGDILGKYVERLIMQTRSSAEPQAHITPDISLDFLQQHGYL